MAKKSDLLKYLYLELPIFIILAVGLPFTQYAGLGALFLLQSFAVSLFFGYIFRKFEKLNKFLFLSLTGLLASGFHKNLFLNFGHSALGRVMKASAFLIYLLALLLLDLNPKFLKEERYFSPLLTLLACAAALLWPPFFFFYLPVLLIMAACRGLSQKPARGSGLLHQSSWFAPPLFFILIVLVGFFTKKPAFIFISPKYLHANDLLLIVKSLVISLPLLMFIAVSWKKLWNNEKNEKKRRLLTFALLHPPAVLLLSLFFSYPNTDSRSFHISALVFGQLCLLVCFTHCIPGQQSEPLEDFADSLTKKPLLLLASLVYMLKAWNFFNPY